MGKPECDVYASLVYDIEDVDGINEEYIRLLCDALNLFVANECHLDLFDEISALLPNGQYTSDFWKTHATSGLSPLESAVANRVSLDVFRRLVWMGYPKEPIAKLDFHPSMDAFVSILALAEEGEQDLKRLYAQAISRLVHKWQPGHETVPPALEAAIVEDALRYGMANGFFDGDDETTEVLVRDVAVMTDSFQCSGLGEEFRRRFVYGIPEDEGQA